MPEPPYLPPTGITFAGTVHRVVDGDTIEVEMIKRVRVRLRDCWAAESHEVRQHPSGKSIGLAATEHLTSIAEGRPCVVQVTTDGDVDVFDGMSMCRFIGDVYDRETGADFGQAQILAGHAYETKAELEDYLTEQDREHHDAM